MALPHVAGIRQRTSGVQLAARLSANSLTNRRHARFAEGKKQVRCYKGRRCNHIRCTPPRYCIGGFPASTTARRATLRGGSAWGMSTEPSASSNACPDCDCRVMHDRDGWREGGDLRRTGGGSGGGSPRQPHPGSHRPLPAGGATSCVVGGRLVVSRDAFLCNIPLRLRRGRLRRLDRKSTRLNSS